MSDYYNGRSKEDVSRLESPLATIEPLLERYGKEYGFELIRNYHDFISRFLHCVTGDKIHQRIDFYLENEKDVSFSMWIMAWQDRDDGRYIKRKLMVKDMKSSSWTSQFSSSPCGARGRARDGNDSILVGDGGPDSLVAVSGDGGIGICGSAGSHPIMFTNRQEQEMKRGQSGGCKKCLADILSTVLWYTCFY